MPKTKILDDLGVQKVKQNEFVAFDILINPSQKEGLIKGKSRLVLLTSIDVVLITTF